MRHITVENKYYQFFGELAVALCTKGITMSYKTLNKVLEDNGFKKYGSSRALASAISAAWRAWDTAEKKNNALNSATASAIANTFTDQNGEFAWWNY